MSAPHGCNENMEVVELFKEALKQRIGADRFRMWFSHGVTFTPDGRASADGSSPASPQRMVVQVHGQFALDRLRTNFLRELRAAAVQACGSQGNVRLELDHTEAVQAELPLDQLPPKSSSVEAPSARSPSVSDKPGRRRGRAQTVSALIAGGAAAPSSRGQSNRHEAPTATQLDLPSLNVAPTSTAIPSNSAVRPTESSSRGSASASVNGTERLGDNAAQPTTLRVDSFIVGPSNQLAYTAMSMVCQTPGTASPLFLCGPTGVGKTHLLSLIADQLRRRHRLRRVIHLSAEQFTNDFISSVGNSGITSFRRRYREVDALLVDDVQFLGSKRATLREMLYTVETLAAAGRPLIFSGNQAPTEISGLTRELAGRMAAGLVCPILPLDQVTREKLLHRSLQEHCQFEVPCDMIATINPMLAGDGRVISGVTHLINTLQRMYGRTPTMDEIRQFGGELLRAAKPLTTLAGIESAVCQTFHLPDQSLRTASQTRAVSEPRMLAMYLSRQLTSAAFAEIAGFYGGRSHSTAMAADKNVRTWLDGGRSIGRGPAAMTAQQAIDRIESVLRSG